MNVLISRRTLLASPAEADCRSLPAFVSARTTNAKSEALIRSRLDEVEWKRIVRVLPARMQARARNNGNARKFVEAVLWVASTHLYWKSMPDEYGDPHTNYMRFVRWTHAGIWDRVLSAMEESSESFAHLYRLVDSYRSKSTMMNMTKASPEMNDNAPMHGGLNQLQGSVRHADRPQHGYSGNA